MFVAAPLIVLTARRMRAPAVLIAVAATLWWLWSPALDGIVRAGRDPSTAVEYHLPLVAAVRAQGGSARPHRGRPDAAPLGDGARRRPGSRSPGAGSVSWTWVATPSSTVPSSTPEAYHEWLREHAVRFVALADAPIDPSGVHEARLVGERPAVPRARVARPTLAPVARPRPRATGRRAGAARRPRSRAHRARRRRRRRPCWCASRWIDALVARSGRVRRRRAPAGGRSSTSTQPGRVTLRAVVARSLPVVAALDRCDR